MSPPTNNRLLLIEDNPGDAELLRAYLDDLPDHRFEIAHVVTLKDALEYLGERYDTSLILLDLMLPDATGVSIIARIHRTAPRVPIVVLSGIADEELGQSAIQAGAQDFLHKDDLDTTTLARSLRYATERARLQTQFRALVENNADALVVIDRNGVVTYLNHAAEELLGRTHEDILGKQFGFPIATGSFSEIEVHDAAGELRAAEMRVAPITWEGENAWLASLRDVTDRKRAEELQKRLNHADRLASIGQLASGVAHEINNPAGFILGNLEVFGEQLSTLERTTARMAREARAYGSPASTRLEDSSAQVLSEMRGMLIDSIAGIERISHIVKALSSFARIERDEVEPVDLNEVLETACKIVKNEIRHRATLEQHLSPLPRIAADPGKLIQVFTNLLINAAQSIAPGAAEQNRVSISTAEDGEQIIVRVSDTGCGIPPEQLQRIFEPFYTTKSRGLGTGLGLPLSSDIVRKHGGDIKVTSTPGEGSTFEVVLPADTGMTARLTSPVASTMPADGHTGDPRGRVLVVDDESMLLDTFHRMLRRTHEVVICEGGGAALALLEQDADYDAIICDLMMPDLDGMQFYRILSERWPALRPKVMFCSGGAFDPEARAFLETANAEHVVIEKPIRREALLRAVREVLRRTARR
ncbi:response regulator [Haliangium ochraceum]|uniref:histidine kinase n=1 Tax=Haliangium ochraceum (strain DSM 14365 / JCM 11303 / SMP-2) TaxID=502025 RepID=D0LRA8_HALO1|nr:response regulator [Haliangium ochraceum]ACY17136.1 PAS/PAC sensor hybrid histidine kinase [Haliangium ochraceum DSM 14365]